MSINELKGATPATSIAMTAEAAPAKAASSNHKTLYGDPSRAEGLMNTMTIMKQLATSAQAVVSSRHASLQ